jgi:hypothetical protein
MKGKIEKSCLDLNTSHPLYYASKNVAGTSDGGQGAYNSSFALEMTSMYACSNSSMDCSSRGDLLNWTLIAFLFPSFHLAPG